jgi:glycyl-tRNA synthetase beta chain
MVEQDDLLIEIGTEELPPKALLKLSRAFTDGIKAGLEKAEFPFAGIKGYAAPRRLAVIVEQTAVRQPDREVERKGPAVKAAYDGDGNPTKALLGFCRSCGAEPEQLERVDTPKGEWLMFRKQEIGKSLEELIPGIIESALNNLPIPKRMRWGAGEEAFVRPVHWLVVLYGNQVIPCTILGQEANNLSYGHRFHHPGPLQLDKPSDYPEVLRAPGKVIVDFDERRERIREMAEQAAAAEKARALIDPDLLDEVTALNEWPNPIVGSFEERFLEVPPEVLIEAMQDHQKYFPMVGGEGKLAPRFITIANIESQQPELVVAGNERVIRPRFSDAAFFWEQDLKHPLEERLDSLKSVVFQKDLGSLLDKTLRVQGLAGRLADMLGADKAKAERAALLCKCDLMTDMVYEFTSLQGIMGRYYAEKCGEEPTVAAALDEVYMPRFAGDDLPATEPGRILALADRIDTLTGIFAAGLKPTGEKDPFGLRRASLGVLRILIETPIDLDLREMITQAVDQLPEGLAKSDSVDEVFQYVMERLRAYYHERSIKPDVIEAVMARTPSRPMDFDRRIRGVSQFFDLPEAASLAAANKRISNILRKAKMKEYPAVDEGLLQEASEQALFKALREVEAGVSPLIDQGDYADALTRMAALREPVDHFFDEVMVMAEDEALRNNRLALLHAFSSLFMRVADLSRLQHS